MDFDADEKGSSESTGSSRTDSEHSTIRDVGSPEDDQDHYGSEVTHGDSAGKNPSNNEAPYDKIMETLRRIEDEEKADHEIPLFSPAPPCKTRHTLRKSDSLRSLTSGPGGDHHPHGASSARLPTSPPQSPTHFKITKSFNKTVPPSNIILCSSMTLECSTQSSSTSSTPRLPPLSVQQNSTNNCYTHSPRIKHFAGSGEGDATINSSNKSDLFELQPTSARSYSEEPLKFQRYIESNRRPSSALGFSVPKSSWEPPNTDKARDIFSFLDEVEKVDRETLFHLKLLKTNPPKSSGSDSGIITSSASSKSRSSTGSSHIHAFDSLMNKGTAELAQELYLMERKMDEYKHNISVLEETVANQRELNIRHIKHSERDLKKRLRLQQEEFDLALTRHQAFVDQVISEKRLLQEKCEKLLRDFKEAEQRHQSAIKSMQEKHLEEIKRLRKIHDSSEKSRKAQWLGSKTQEIRETTLKGLEPQLQRVIRRHQSEMAEMRAWHENELQEIEERSSRKFAQQAKELREQTIQELESNFSLQRESLQRRHESELNQIRAELEAQKHRYIQDLQVLEQRLSTENSKAQDTLKEQLKGVETKSRIELENLKQEYEGKLLSQQNQHAQDLRTLRSAHESELEANVSSYNQKLESAIAEKEAVLLKRAAEEKAQSCEDQERKLRQEMQRVLKESEEEFEAKMKRQQDKWHKEVQEMEEAERELKHKLAILKSQLMSKEDEIFSLKSQISSKEKQLTELTENNAKMIEERVNLTAVIKKEFETQIENLEQNCLQVKSAILEIKTKHKIQEEHHAHNMEKLKQQKDAELQNLGQRVVQAMTRKDETIAELQTQLDNSALRIHHLEDLLEQQRKEFLHNIPPNTKSHSASNNKATFSKHHQK